jgi:hypothetical protein
MQQQLQPKYLNVKGAANYCGLSTRRIELAVARAEVTSFLKGKRRLILRESIDSWIEGKSAIEASLDVGAQIVFHASEIQRLLGTIFPRDN